jgi:hypothetical protein
MKEINFSARFVDELTSVALCSDSAESFPDGHGFLRRFCAGDQGVLSYVFWQTRNRIGCFRRKKRTEQENRKQISHFVVPRFRHSPGPAILHLVMLKYMLVLIFAALAVAGCSRSDNQTTVKPQSTPDAERLRSDSERLQQATANAAKEREKANQAPSPTTKQT